MSDISPAVDWEAIDPSGDDVVLSRPCRAVTIGTGGVINAVRPGETEPTATNTLPAGTYAMRFKEVKTSGTTAGNFTVWW